MAQLLVALIGGASLGGTFALIGMGLVIALRATATFNFAQGALMLLPAFLLGDLQSRSVLSFGPDLLIVLAASALIGIFLYLFVLQYTLGQFLFVGVIVTFGFTSILDGVMTIAFPRPQYAISIPWLPKGVFSFGGARFSESSITLTIFTLLLAGVVAAVMRLTPAGQRIQAAGQDPLLASQRGINVRVTYMGSWALAAVLAAIAGITYGAEGLVTFDMQQFGLVAIPAIIIGGLDSVEGSVIGAIAVGVVAGFVTTYLGSDYVDMITYSLLLVVLLLRPQGLFGTRQIVRV